MAFMNSLDMTICFFKLRMWKKFILKCKTYHFYSVSFILLVFCASDWEISLSSVVWRLSESDLQSGKCSSKPTWDLLAQSPGKQRRKQRNILLSSQKWTQRPVGLRSEKKCQWKEVPSFCYSCGWVSVCLHLFRSCVSSSLRSGF